MHRLQVYKDNKWQYVVCYNDRSLEIITTNNHLEALPKEALDFFVSKFGSYKFRVARPLTVKDIREYGKDKFFPNI